MSDKSMTVRRTRCAPSPRRGEGWGEGVRTYRETVPPHPTPLPMGEGAGRCSRHALPHTATILGTSHASRRAPDQDLRELHRPDRRRHPRCQLRRSRPARSSPCSGRPAAARPRPCAASPASKRRTRARSRSTAACCSTAPGRVNVPVEQRAVGMVFQSYAIWPHMTVAENVAFPLTVMKHRKYSRAEIEAAVAKALAVVDLAGFQDRPAPRLSGGQQQRVALARAIVHEPRLLAARRAACPISTRNCATRCARSSSACKARSASPPSMSPTTSRRRWRSPTRSR